MSHRKKRADRLGLRPAPAHPSTRRIPAGRTISIAIGVLAFLLGSLFLFQVVSSMPAGVAPPVEPTIAAPELAPPPNLTHVEDFATPVPFADSRFQVNWSHDPADLWLSAWSDQAGRLSLDVAETAQRYENPMGPGFSSIRVSGSDWPGVGVIDVSLSGSGRMMLEDAAIMDDLLRNGTFTCTPCQGRLSFMIPTSGQPLDVSLSSEPSGALYVLNAQLVPVVADTGVSTTKHLSRGGGGGGAYFLIYGDPGEEFRSIRIDASLGGSVPIDQRPGLLLLGELFLGSSIVAIEILLERHRSLRSMEGSKGRPQLRGRNRQKERSRRRKSTRRGRG